jgi:hypothetical protein
MRRELQVLQGQAANTLESGPKPSTASKQQRIPLLFLHKHNVFLSLSAHKTEE